MISRLLLSLALLMFTQQLTALDVLEPVKTESPRDTLRTFMEAMDQYREGVEKGDEEKEKSIARAIKTLDLSNQTGLLQDEVGKKAAVYLKEVIDRVLVVDYSKVPNGGVTEGLPRWRLKNTEITIVLIEQGERKGEYLFSKTR